MYGSRKTLELLDDYRGDDADKDILDAIEQQKIELQKERQKFFDQRNAFNKAVRERAREEELNEILASAIAEGNLPALEYVPAEHNGDGDNDLLVSLNDIHYGGSVDNFWMQYNPDICRGMFRKYLDEIIHTADTHKSENCYICNAGDSISGNIHYSIAVTNKENVIDQVKGVSELISEFIAELSKHFRNVYYFSVPGNHSRITPNKEDALADERLDDLIEWYLEARLQGFENVHIGCGDRIDPTIGVIDIRGKLYAVVHGDMDMSPAKIQSIQTMIQRPSNQMLYAVLCGHKHHNCIDTVQGVKTVMAGSFLGMDDFCVQKRIYGEPEQMICVCNNTGIKCYYDVFLNR